MRTTLKYLVMLIPLVITTFGATQLFWGYGGPMGKPVIINAWQLQLSAVLSIITIMYFVAKFLDYMERRTGRKYA